MVGIHGVLGSDIRAVYHFVYIRGFRGTAQDMAATSPAKNRQMSLFPRSMPEYLYGGDHG